MHALAFTLPALFYVAGVILATGPRWRRVLGFLPASSGLLTPFALPAEWPAARAILALVELAAFLRAVDLVVRSVPLPLASRLVHAFSVVDSTTLRRAPPRFDRPSALRVVLFTGVLLAGRSIVLSLAPRVPWHPGSLAVRWLGALVWVYGLSDLTYTAVVFLNHALGFTAPAIHRDPVLSRTLREFWGRRWNRIVGAWLDARIYRPMARRGHPAAGMTSAFLVSMLIHVYVAAAPLGAMWGAIVGVFFVVQGLFALIEGPLGVARWPRAAAHAWVILVLAGSSPLFCEAFLRVLGD